jgi:hypothetical protein
MRAVVACHSLLLTNFAICAENDNAVLDFFSGSGGNSPCEADPN